MVSLITVGKRYEIPFTVIEGGSGIATGILSETDQAAQPSYVFVQPRHVLRTPGQTAIKPGMVIRSPAGYPFIVGANGPSEQPVGQLWQSFRLFEPTGQYLWQRRTKIKDVITHQDKEGPMVTMGLIWAALESLDRPAEDRAMRITFEQQRIISGSPIQSDDVVDNRAVTKVDKQLGLAIGTLT